VTGRPEVVISPRRLNFCFVQLGDLFSKRLWVYNTGNDTLSVSSVRSDHLTSYPTRAFTVLPGQEHDLC
jgi:hypothetical protein